MSTSKPAWSWRAAEMGVVVVLALLSATLAGLLFALFDSTAAFDKGGLKLGGAVAGFAATFFILHSAYIRTQSATQGIKDVLRENKELEEKLLGGVPRPLEYDIEVEEKQRLVLARPTAWEPRGGTVLALEAPTEESRADLLPAQFEVHFEPIDRERYPTPEDWYDRLLQELETGEGPLSPPEVIHVGGSPAGIKSVRVVQRRYYRVTETRGDGLERHRTTLSASTRAEFHLRVLSAVDKLLRQRGLYPPRTFEEREHIAAQREEYVAHVEQQLEAGVLDPRGSLDSAIERFLDQEYNLPAIQRQPVASDQTGAVEEARRGVAGARAGSPGRAPSEHADASSGATLSEPKGESPERDEVLPVAQVLVSTYHAEIGKIFYFAFFDNVADYRRTSENFNRIMESVRFLA